ncbi:SDR family NAD(P)-dependent oxidoreductase [Williamsia serinedens]|uniref:3-oxoacyl-[acyl-carrier-protein] reductase MabA n=1 Tax=Williamsia serinedens TaxID=391736 RepID=A0ABT1H8R7_9NOCA|nr:SDR family NAD(P)-dependent oxidoreductase [Williamsia serinedens]MCP2163015.1 3-oxoacyl-[acyl-carrier protein] reductase [Williamsia serinedens]
MTIDDRPLSGRTALITGASGGIGGSIARHLARLGADLVLAHGRHADDAERAAQDAREVGARAITTPGDLSDPDVPARLADVAIGEFGAVDILIANAGIGAPTPLQDVTLQQWEETYAVNVTAPFLLAQRLLPAMYERSFGRVVFISSIAALNGGVIGPHYASSKAALHGLTHSLAKDAAPHGVTVNAIAPALIGGTRILPTDPSGGDELPMPIPVGRLGEPDEIGSVTASVVTNGYLTNKIITVDGGLLPR